MNTSTKPRFTVLIAGALIAGALIAAAPAAALTDAPDAVPASTPPLPRSAGEATPFVAEVAPEALRRDPGQATPFAAEVAPEATPPGDAFDWGDAALGAGASLLVVALAAAGSTALGSIRKRYPSESGGAAQRA